MMESEFRGIIEHELADMESLRQIILDRMGEKPTERIHISTHDGKNYFYSYRDGKRTYLPKAQMDYAVRCAQFDYDSQNLKILNQRILACRRMLHTMSPSLIENYEKLPIGRKEIVKAIVLTDEEFIKDWYEQHPGNQNTYQIEYGIKSDKEENMRSKSEVLIANLLNKRRIPYVYEPKLSLKGGKSVYPDFLLLDIARRKTIILEHFGMLDNPQYARAMHEKLNLYLDNNYFLGDNLIFTLETSNQPIDTKRVGKQLSRFFAS